MTLALIFGGIAAAYLLWLLFRLAAIALPVCVGIAAATALLDRGASYPAAIGWGLALGVAILMTGRMLIASNIAPALKAAAVLAFAAPAALAGYSAARTLAVSAGIDGAALPTLSLAAGAAVALASWRSLAGPLSRMPTAPRAGPGVPF